MPVYECMNAFAQACSGKACRNSNCCVFPLCNATQPATINLLSRNVESQRIPIKSSSSARARVCVCSLCVFVCS